MENTSATTTYIDLPKRDRNCIWHPFTQMRLNSDDAIPIVRGEKAYLYAADGKKYLDGISSWWVNLHGHSHPYIAERICMQAHQLEHVIFAGFTHQPAIELGERLIKILPGNMSKIFYSDNGSTAVEVALKMAIQYWSNHRVIPPRVKVICFKGSYHGDTFGAMSVSGKNSFNRPFWSHLFDVEMIDPPFSGQEERSLQQLQSIINKELPACFIFEPLILGVGGMRIYSAAGLDALLALCRKNHILTIADEVLTGFGRTGSLFACDVLQEKPDLICLAKGLTGGFLPLSVTACSEKIYNAFLSEDPTDTFLHGHSYTANPLACSAALASLDLLEKEDCIQQRKRISASHQNFCMQWKNHPRVMRCESLGTILALEYRTEETSSYFHSMRNQLSRFFLERGVLLRPLGNVIYVLPPYCIEVHELEYIYDQLISTLEHPS